MASNGNGNGGGANGGSGSSGSGVGGSGGGNGGGGSGTAREAAAMQQALAGNRGTNVKTKNFSGYKKQKSTVHPLNFIEAAVNPDEASEMFDKMIELHGISPADDIKYSDAMDTIYMIFYLRHASGKMNMTDTIKGYGGVEIEMPKIAEVLSAKVGTEYRRWIRGMSDIFWDMATINNERFFPCFRMRQRDLSLPTVDEAIAAMDGMDKCTKTNTKDTQRNFAVRGLHLRYQSNVPVGAEIANIPLGLLPSIEGNGS